MYKLKLLDVSMFGNFKYFIKYERVACMEKNPRREVKRFGLTELTSTSFKRALTPLTIKVISRRTGIWPLNLDAILHDIVCIQDFDVHDNEDADVENNILSLSYGHC